MKTFVFFIISIAISVISNAQSITPEIISTAGDYSVGTNATLSWTLGEPVMQYSHKAFNKTITMW